MSGISASALHSVAVNNGNAVKNKPKRMLSLRSGSGMTAAAGTCHSLYVPASGRFTSEPASHWRSRRLRPPAATRATGQRRLPLAPNGDSRLIDDPAIGDRRSTAIKAVVLMSVNLVLRCSRAPSRLSDRPHVDALGHMDTSELGTPRRATREIQSWSSASRELTSDFALLPRRVHLLWKDRFP